MKIKEDGRISDEGSIEIRIDSGSNARSVAIALECDEFEQQKKKPTPSSIHNPEGPNVYWLFRNRLLFIQDFEALPEDELLLRIKHFVYQKEQEFERIKKEVDEFETRGRF